MRKETLNKIIENHKLWIKTEGREGKRANLSGESLYGVNLKGVDLRFSNMCGVNMENAVLENANLMSVDLRDSDLSGINLKGADLSGGNLSGADLSNSDLSGADLSGAALSGTDLKEADLKDVNLDYSAFPLWCGGVDVNIDERQAIQLLYHLLKNVFYSKNISTEFKELFKDEKLIKKANEFHEIKECGKIKI